VLLNGHRFARFVVDEIDLRQLHQHRYSIAHLEDELTLTADDLFRRDAVNSLSPRPHEFDAAARDNEGFKPVVAQIREQLDHRLKHELRVRHPHRCHPRVLPVRHRPY
jgi:hypothetical protein